jgi:N-acetylmuramoyl-L-alanine amidase
MATTLAAKRRARSRVRRRRGIALATVIVLVSAVLAAVDGGFGGTGSLTALADGGQPVDAGGFAPGSCVAYAPTADDLGKTVFLDAGHGGIDPGAVGTTRSGATIHEADETLPVELEAMSLLRAEGFRVIVSRTRSSAVVKLTSADLGGGTLSLRGAHDDVVARDLCADEAGADALVGIYYDAGASAQNAGSITAYDPDRSFAAASLRLARLVQHDVLVRINAQGWAIPDDGVQTDDQLGSLSGDPTSGGIAAQAAAYHHLLLLGPARRGYFTTPSTMPGAVIEPLYITDPFEASIAASIQGQRVIAQGIAAAVGQYLAPRPTAAASGTSP